MQVLDKNMRKDTIFHFLAHYYDAANPISGGEKYNFHLVEALEKEGYSVVIYTDDKIPGFFKKNYALYNLWYLMHLAKFKGSIVLVDDYMHPRLFLFLLFVKVFTGTKVIGTVHHLYWCIQKSRLRRWLDRLIENVFISRFDHLIIPSAYTLGSVKAIVGEMPRAHIIHPGIERPAQNSFPQKRQYVPGRRVTLIFVGAIQERKGVVELIQAFSKVTYQDTYLYLVGEIEPRPEYVDKVRSAIRDHDLDHRACLCGRISTQELNRLYHEADIFILPSFHEGYGMVVAEAMHFGLPIITSNVTALPEIVEDGVNGLLVAPGDVEGIAKAIDELSWSPEKRKAFGEKSLELAQRTNTWEDVENQFMNVVDELVVTR
jgi:glycosyltransferase involved in cell wall biosynthesis